MIDAGGEWPELACPRCRRAVEAESAHALRCRSCGRLFPIRAGIPLTGGQETRPSVTERIADLEARFARSDHADLLARFFDGRMTRSRVERWVEDQVPRHEAFVYMFLSRYEGCFARPKRRVALELGCGTGLGLPPLARDFDLVYGVDLSLPSLIIARKLLEDQGIDNVRIVHGSVHELPFADASFDYVTAVNVIEHAFRPRHLFEEIRRVLAPEGAFAGDSRNRFDPLFPEPHVHLMWVGFLPRRWMDRYVRFRIGKGYDGKYLLSHSKLRDSVRHSFGRAHRIVLPELRAYRPDAPSWLHRAVEAIHEHPALERALLPVFPTHVALAHKTA
jgi:ubiquinone/menaquinone biosynthesis C-methylase UbiE/uncharacterized protein YbaR (Trm112 family)